MSEASKIFWVGLGAYIMSFGGGQIFGVLSGSGADIGFWLMLIGTAIAMLGAAFAK